ncbi:ankyrin repeat domain-containing protein [Luedemannella flava]
MTDKTLARRAFVDHNATSWLTARRFAVPARMVAGAGERRLAGDWRGACAAAGVDVAIDLPDVANRFGAEVAGRVEDDLRHLVPDLVRWHLPRRGQGRHGPAHARSEDPARRLRRRHAVRRHARPHRAPAAAGAAPRAAPLARGRQDDWIQGRYLWDARETHLLLHRVGGGDRTPFFDRDGRPRAADGVDNDPVALMERVLTLQDAGEVEQAWAVAGVPATFPEAKRRWGDPGADDQFPEGFGAMVPALVPVARRLLNGPDAPDGILLRPSFGWTSPVLLRLDDGELRASRADRNTRDMLELHRVHWQRFPDVELLRTDRITTAELHPLVRAALFPDEADPGYQPRVPSVAATAVPVRCRGQWHKVGWRDGRTYTHDHTEEEAQRERVMRALGGEVPGCFTVAETWQGSTTARLPRALRELRSHALTALAHGNADEFTHLLDVGVDPVGVRDRWNRGPLHKLAKLHGDQEALLKRLLAAGMDINGRDGKERTPLAAALFDGASADLARAMLDAGADPSPSTSPATRRCTCSARPRPTVSCRGWSRRASASPTPTSTGARRSWPRC